VEIPTETRKKSGKKKVKRRGRSLSMRERREGEEEDGVV